MIFHNGFQLRGDLNEALLFLTREINHCPRNLRVNISGGRQGGRRMPRAFTFELKLRRSFCNCGRNNVLAVTPDGEYSKRILGQATERFPELFLNFPELRATVEIFA